MRGVRGLAGEVSDNNGDDEFEMQVSSGASLGDVELSGRVKWFDTVKGYGFITPDDDGGDVLIHYNLLSGHGRKSVPEGTLVTALVRAGPRGRQASAILAIDTSQAVEKDEAAASRRATSRVDPLDYLEEAGDYEPVQVRWFNRTKGYGFLLRGDGVTEVFIHMETVRRGGFETLLPGQSILARVHSGPRGALAVAVLPGRDDQAH